MNIGDSSPSTKMSSSNLYTWMQVEYEIFAYFGVKYVV